MLTETSRLAVPEITIGLFPDAGGTWSLGQMEPHIASFLGLTGSHINAADALQCGWGNFVVPQDTREAVIEGIMALPFAGGDPHAVLDEYLSSQAQPELKPSQLAAIPQVQPILDDMSAEVARTLALSGQTDWIDKGVANLRNGCSTTAGIVVEQLRRVPELSLADSYRLELVIAHHCATNSDFQEGVRALLIDKDNAPAWRFGSIENLNADHVASHFEAPWDAHPLADLGA